MSDTTATRRQVIRLESVFSVLHRADSERHGQAGGSEATTSITGLRGPSDGRVGLRAGGRVDGARESRHNGARERTGHTTSTHRRSLPHCRRCRCSARRCGLPVARRAPTKVIFLVLWPTEQREQHFELMGRLSALFGDKSMLMCLQGQRKANLVYEYLKDLDARATDFAVSRVELSTTAFRK